MVCSRQPRSFQGVDRTDGQMDNRMDDEWMDENLFVLFGWMDWMDDGMDDRTDSGEASFLIPMSFTIY